MFKASAVPALNPASAKTASQPLSRPSHHNSSLNLQRALGNGDLARMFGSSPGNERDRFEREADEVADKVMAAEEHAPLGAIPAAPSIQAKGKSGGNPSVEHGGGAAVREAAQGGAPLPGNLRSFFEPRFGRDLGGVRVHSGPEADKAAGSIEARAYTYGSHIVFGVGEYSPGTTAGGKLLAHELVHVVQQAGGSEIGGVHSAGESIQRSPKEDAARSGAEGWAGLVAATVQELDKRESHYFSSTPKYGDADFEKLIDILTVAIDKGWWQMWALALQQREGPFGNYLFHFHMILADKNKGLADKFGALLKQRGIAIGVESGGYQSLAYLDPTVEAPVNPAVANLPFSQGVDRFKTATYDLGYKPGKPGSLSTTLKLSYDDGVTIDVSIWDISDNIDSSARNAVAQSYVGPGGRVFPSRMSRNTTPRLWAEKQKALAVMEADNQDFETFVSIGLAGVMSNLPIGPVVGPEPVEPVSVPRVSRPPAPNEGTIPGDTAAPPKQLKSTTPPPRQLESGTHAPGRPATPPAAERIPGSTDGEHAIDQLLRQEGREVKANPMEGVRGAGRQGDRLVDGVPTEEKSISGVKKPDADSLSSAIARRVMDGRGQARNIIVDTRQQTGVTREIAERGIRRAYGADNATGAKIQSIRVIGTDFDITLPRAN